MGRPKTKKIYLTNEEFAEALQESQREGQPTIKVCNHFRSIAQHLLGNPKYRRYPHDTQEDMVSAALLKCIKNIKNFKREYAEKCFNYYTRVVEHAFWETLTKMYKQANIVREATRRYADQLESFSPIAAQAVRDTLLPENTTNTLTTNK